MAKYRAFISYSHQEQELARRLHTRLETFVIPSDVDSPLAGQALGSVFLDEAVLGAAHDLSDTIRHALDNTDALILLASPAAARSRWVNEEVIYFRSQKPNAPCLPIIARGRPDSGEAEDQCYPPGLRFKLLGGKITSDPHDALGSDIVKDGEDVAFLKLVAGIINADYEALSQRHMKREREVRERQRRAFAKTYAVAARQALDNNRPDRAIKCALSYLIDACSLDRRAHDGTFDYEILQLRDAMELAAVSNEATTRLSAVSIFGLFPGYIRTLDFSPSGLYLAAGSGIHPADGKKAISLPDMTQSLQIIDCSTQKSVFATDEYGEILSLRFKSESNIVFSTKNAAYEINFLNNKIENQIHFPTNAMEAVIDKFFTYVLCHTGNKPFLIDLTNSKIISNSIKSPISMQIAYLLRFKKNKAMYKYPFVMIHPDQNTGYFTIKAGGFEFIFNGTKFITSPKKNSKFRNVINFRSNIKAYTENGALHVRREHASERLTFPNTIHVEHLSQLATTEDLGICAASTFKGEIHLSIQKTPSINRTLYGHVGGVSELICSPSGEQLASSGFDRTVRLWRTNLPSDLRTFPAVFSVAFDKSTGYLQTTSPQKKRGKVQTLLWNVSIGTLEIERDAKCTDRSYMDVFNRGARATSPCQSYLATIKQQGSKTWLQIQSAEGKIISKARLNIEKNFDKHEANLAFSKDSKLISINYKNHIMIFELNSLHIILNDKAENILNIENFDILGAAYFSPTSSKVIFSVYKNNLGRFICYDINSKESKFLWKSEAPIGNKCLSFFADETHAVFPIDKGIAIVDLDKNTVKMILDDSEDYNLAFYSQIILSPNEKFVAVSLAHELRIWDLQSGAVVLRRDLNSPADMAFSPNGEYLAISDQSMIGTSVSVIDIKHIYHQNIGLVKIMCASLDNNLGCVTVEDRFDITLNTSLSSEDPQDYAKALIKRFPKMVTDAFDEVDTGQPT